MASITVRGITKRFPAPDGSTIEALRNIDLDVGDGEFTCLLGPSGCGKSTLLNVMAGLLRADEGTVRLHGEGDREPTVTYMFQESRLLPWMTVEDNLHFVLDAPRAERTERVAEWLRRVGLADFARYYPQQLSVGMQQRVSVARALIVQPDVLLMDEPFSSLDELTAMTMREQLLELWEDLGCTVVFVTHNPLEATLLADRMVIMAGPPGHVADDMELRQELPRPRDADEAKLWRISREAVKRLRERDQEADQIGTVG